MGEAEVDPAEGQFELSADARASKLAYPLKGKDQVVSGASLGGIEVIKWSKRMVCEGCRIKTREVRGRRVRSWCQGNM
jgi:hypothetical protein